MHEFDTDTAVRARGDGFFDATVTDRWGVSGRPNGGYLMAMGLRALGHVLPHPDPLTVTTHFLRAPEPGPVEIAVDAVRQGRRLSVGEARLQRGDREYVRMIAAFSDLAAADGPTDVRAQPPDLPPREECFRPTEQLIPATIAQRFELYFHPDATGWMRNDASGSGEIAAWIRFADDRPNDLLSLVQIVDALPPAVFELGLIDPVPTVELTAHLRAYPAPGWLRVVVRTRNLIDGFLEEEAEVWDSKDRLVAQSRQLALLVGLG